MNLQLVYRYILSLSKNKNMFYEKKKKKKWGQIDLFTDTAAILN